MRVRNVDFPGRTAVLQSSDAGGDVVTATLLVTAWQDAVFRITNMDLSGLNEWGSTVYANENPYCSFHAMTDSDFFSFSYSSATEYIFAPSNSGNFNFKYDSAGSPPNQGDSIRFSFDLEVEDPPGSGIFVPVTNDNAAVVFNGDGAVETDLPPPPQPVYCFWSDLQFVVQSACEMPPAEEP